MTLVNGIVVFFLVFIMRRFELSVSLLGYGILSIFGYMVFLIWLAASAPPGPNKYPVFTWQFADLCNALATAFSMQGVFIPVLRKNKISTQNGTLLLVSFVLGGIIYAYIGFAGSYGTRQF
jgi:hypothetical protein